MFDQGTAFPSAARTATPTASIIYVPTDAEYLEVVVNTSAAGVTPSVVFNIDFMDAEGNWASVLASAAVAATGVTRLRVGPALVAVANVAQPAVLPAAVRIRPVHGNGTTITYSVGYWFRG